MEQTTIEEIRKILAKGYEQGESWKEQKKKIENKIKNPVRAEMIAITELGFCLQHKHKNTYREAGANKVAWHASLDLKLVMVVGLYMEKCLILIKHQIIPCIHVADVHGCLTFFQKEKLEILTILVICSIIIVKTKYL